MSKEERQQYAPAAGRCDQHGVEPHVAVRIDRMGLQPDRGGACDPLLLAIGYRIGCIVQGGARLHFDEDQEVAPSCHDIDLARGAAPAPRQDAKALSDQESGGAALGRDVDPERDLSFRRRNMRLRRGGPPFRLHGGPRGGEFVRSPRHRHHPWRARVHADRRCGEPPRSRLRFRRPLP